MAYCMAYGIPYSIGFPSWSSPSISPNLLISRPQLQSSSLAFSAGGGLLWLSTPKLYLNASSRVKADGLQGTMVGKLLGGWPGARFFLAWSWLREVPMKDGGIVGWTWVDRLTIKLPMFIGQLLRNGICESSVCCQANMNVDEPSIKNQTWSMNIGKKCTRKIWLKLKKSAWFFSFAKLGQDVTFGVKNIIAGIELDCTRDNQNCWGIHPCRIL